MHFLILTSWCFYYQNHIATWLSPPYDHDYHHLSPSQTSSEIYHSSTNCTMEHFPPLALVSVARTHRNGGKDLEKMSVLVTFYNVLQSMNVSWYEWPQRFWYSLFLLTEFPICSRISKQFLALIHRFTYGCSYLLAPLLTNRCITGRLEMSSF